MKARKSAVEQTPTAKSLREMPELEALPKRAQRGAFRKRAEAAGGYHDGPDGETWTPLKRGRPKSGTKAETTSPRSVRFPTALWKQLDAEAKKRGTTRHALLRELVSKWLKRAA